MSLDRTQAPAFSLSTNYSLTQPEKFLFPGGQPLYAFRGIQQSVVKLELCFRAGKWFEPASGISHFTAQLIRKGTRSRSSAEIAEALDRLGATLEILPGFDTVTVSLFVLRKNFYPALTILLDLVQEPLFPEDELRKEKELFIQNLRINNEKTSVVASREIRKSIFGSKHPYGNSTEENDVQVISTTAIGNFYHTDFSLYAGYFLGQLEDGDIQKFLSLFPTTPGKPSTTNKPVVDPGASRSLPKPGSVQASVRLGKRFQLKRADAEYFDAVMVNHLLGGYFGSRLMKNIREEKGLTYGIYSAMHHFLQDSFWIIAAEVNQQNTQEALDEIRKEVRQLQTEPVSVDELEVARNYFIGSWQSDNSTLFAIAEKIRNIHDFRLPGDYYVRMLEHLQRMTPADVQRAANTYFGVDDLIEVRVG